MGIFRNLKLNMIEIKEYQEKSKRTLNILEDDLSNDIHMVLGLVTESSEIADVYKKHIAYNQSIDYINVKEEIGDIMFYVANLCNLHDWDLREIMNTNIKKLEARYPERFTEVNAINRNLDVERNILEQ